VISRIGKTLFTATLGLFFLLVAIDNIIDYGTNFQFVEHVLRMDSIPAGSHVQWRATQSPQLHHLAYWVIILWELTAGALCSFGAIGLLRALRSARDFRRAMRIAAAGLWLGLLLWAFAFITVGGEWFMMWKSTVWNGELAAFRMFTVNAFALLFLYLPDGPDDRSSSE